MIKNEIKAMVAEGSGKQTRLGVALKKASYSGGLAATVNIRIFK